MQTPEKWWYTALIDLASVRGGLHWTWSSFIGASIFDNVLYVMGSPSWGWASVSFLSPFEHEGLVFLALKFEVSFSCLCVFLRVHATAHFTSSELSTLIIFCGFAFLHGS